METNRTYTRAQTRSDITSLQNDIYGKLSKMEICRSTFENETATLGGEALEIKLKGNADEGSSDSTFFEVGNTYGKVSLESIKFTSNATVINVALAAAVP